MDIKEEAGEKDPISDQSVQQESSQSTATTDINRDLSSSPGGQSNSSSSNTNRQPRIVELLQDKSVNTIANCGNANDEQQRASSDWFIEAEFYNEDVVENLSQDTNEDGDEDNDYDENGLSDHDDRYSDDGESIARMYLRRFVNDHVDRTMANYRGQNPNHQINDPEVLRIEFMNDGDENWDHDIIDYHEEDDDDDDDGFVFAPDDDEVDIRSTVSSSSSSSDSSEREDNREQFDITLPSNHGYLGDNLVESRGRQVLIEGQIATIPVFNLSYIVLFPGQVLPIEATTLDHAAHSHIKECLAQNKTTFGFMWRPQIHDIGTTAEITKFTYSDSNRDDLKLILTGRQRFRLMSAPTEMVLMDGQVQILPEILLGNPYSRSLWSSSLMKFPSRIRDEFNSRCPAWLFKKYDVNNIMSRILLEIRNWCRIKNISNNPIDFSYWMSSNLPIDLQDRMKALKFDCAEARLLWLLETLKKNDFFGCNYCRNSFCLKADVFQMSSSGIQCTFVNPSGYLHDLLTVKNVIGVLHGGAWSNQCSWFPGYVWQVLYCGSCQSHIGWAYKRTKNSDLKPKKFFGLSRQHVRLLCSSDTDHVSTNRDEPRFAMPL